MNLEYFYAKKVAPQSCPNFHGILWSYSSTVGVAFTSDVKSWVVMSSARYEHVASNLNRNLSSTSPSLAVFHLVGFGLAQFAKGRKNQ